MKANSSMSLAAIFLVLLVESLAQEMEPIADDGLSQWHNGRFTDLDMAKIQSVLNLPSGRVKRRPACCVWIGNYRICAGCTR
jgi:hypothetical protein